MWFEAHCTAKGEQQWKLWEGEGKVRLALKQKYISENSSSMVSSPSERYSLYF